MYRSGLRYAAYFALFLLAGCAGLTGTQYVAKDVSLDVERVCDLDLESAGFSKVELRWRYTPTMFPWRHALYSNDDKTIFVLSGLTDRCGLRIASTDGPVELVDPVRSTIYNPKFPYGTEITAAYDRESRKCERSDISKIELDYTVWYAEIVPPCGRYLTSIAFGIELRTQSQVHGLRALGSKYFVWRKYRE